MMRVAHRVKGKTKPKFGQELKPGIYRGASWSEAVKLTLTGTFGK
jgi:hypothetical protein